MMKNAGHICAKCIYKILNRLRLQGAVINFKYNNSGSANVIETLFNQIYEETDILTVIGPLVSHRHIIGKWCPDNSDFIFSRIFINLQIPRADIKSQTSLILAQFWLLSWELSAFEGPIDFGKCCPDDSDFSLYCIFIRLTGNEDSHKILDEFDFGSDWTIHMTVTCPLDVKWGKCRPTDSDYIFKWLFIIPDNKTDITSPTSMILAQFWLLVW